MVVLYTDWVSQSSVGDCNNPDEPECNGAVWRFTFTDGSVEDICRDCGRSVQIKTCDKQRKLEELQKQLDAHWKNTAEERERTHTGKLYKKYLEEIKVH